MNLALAEKSIVNAKEFQDQLIGFNSCTSDWQLF